MSEDGNRRKHITEALGGRYAPPWSHEEREEIESAEGYLKAVGSCYNALQSRETDPERKAALDEKYRFYFAEAQRVSEMTREERQGIIQTMPGLLRELRSERGL